MLAYDYMKLNFDRKSDNEYHQYCIHCHKETIKPVQQDYKTLYECGNCHDTYDRSIVIDPAIKWWVDETDEYWHESAGMFIKDSLGRFLFFERTIFPFALTVPSGHVDVGEDALHAASREVFEEIGIKPNAVQKIATEKILDDSCRRGADAHLWHAFSGNIDSENDIKLNHEGLYPQWLTIDEALSRDIISPVRYILKHHREKFQI